MDSLYIQDLHVLFACFHDGPFREWVSVLGLVPRDEGMLGMQQLQGLSLVKVIFVNASFGWACVRDT